MHLITSSYINNTDKNIIECLYAVWLSMIEIAIGYILLFLIIIGRITTEGEVGNSVHFRDCIFEGNSALFYGGAVGMIIPSAATSFGNKHNVIPVEFDSWQVYLMDYKDV